MNRRAVLFLGVLIGFGLGLVVAGAHFAERLATLEANNAFLREQATTAPEAGAVGTTAGREPENDTTREGADR